MQAKGNPLAPGSRLALKTGRSTAGAARRGKDVRYVIPTEVNVKPKALHERGKGVLGISSSLYGRRRCCIVSPH